MRRDVGQRAKPGSGDHRSETGGRYIDIGISLVVIYIHLSLLIVYFSWTKEAYFARYMMPGLIFFAYDSVLCCH